MVELKIGANEQDTQTYILAHNQICTIFAPVSHTPLTVELWGSHDGTDYGPIHLFPEGRVASFPLTEHFRPIVFDPQVFEGIQYFKLHLDRPSVTPLTFAIYVKTN